MEKIIARDTDFTVRLEQLINRPAVPPEIEEQVSEIISAVAREGDQAVIRYAEKLDRVRLEPARFKVTREERQQSRLQTDDSLGRAITTAHAQIADFARQRIPRSWSYKPRPGVELGELFQPLTRIGVYIPGGTAPLISTVLHTVTLARTAGVAEIVATTPPGPQGQIHPALTFAAELAGTSELLRLGGVYAIAALALGTETITRVEKIVGPGNAYVTAAKRQLYGRVALDMVAGPSEIMIIADHTADPRLAAADMLSQIEHGSGLERAVLATDRIELLEAVEKQLLKQSEKLGRGDYIRACLDQGVCLIQFPDLPAAVEFAGLYAPEHLEIMCDNGDEMARQVTAAGAIFIGPWTPEPVGDFVAGPSHVLPTGGAARFFSGLTVEQFFRRISTVKYDRQALQRELPAIVALAAAEGLTAHERSAACRFD